MRFGVSEVDAITQVIPGLPPMIFVNADAPMDRLRFTLAHELGHLIMHAFASPDMESQADRFAAEFLMPAEDIRAQFVRVTLPLLMAMKAYWKVSMAALAYHAKRLEAITERQYIRIRTEMSRLGFVKHEPASTDIPREEPVLLRGLVAFHVEHLKYGIEDLGRVLFDYPERIRDFYLPTHRACA
jgi:Zn-dependent peptidase ImmA (M78 family)